MVGGEDLRYLGTGERLLLLLSAAAATGEVLRLLGEGGDLDLDRLLPLSAAGLSYGRDRRLYLSSSGAEGGEECGDREGDAERGSTITDWS